MSTDTVGMHINEASQLEYNRITPLPAATSNAPFEQTFRITVLLPKDQLYVTRLGARVPLSKLLSLVCDNKQLDADKYEFRNPGEDRYRLISISSDSLEKHTYIKLYISRKKKQLYKIDS